MFFVLDTDHFTALVAGGAPAARISRKAEELDADLFSTIITAQEVMVIALDGFTRARGLPLSSSRSRPGPAGVPSGH